MKPLIICTTEIHISAHITDIEFKIVNYDSVVPELDNIHTGNCTNCIREYMWVTVWQKVATILNFRPLNIRKRWGKAIALQSIFFLREI